MSKELEKLQFVHDFLERTKSVTLLVVAESSGSSPGRAGYKMAVAADGDLFGSIGGGVMEVNLVEWSRAILSEPGAVATGFLVEQVHRRNAENASGMICSGRQTVILKQLTAEDLPTVERIVANLESHSTAAFEISNLGFQIVERTSNSEQTFFKRDGEVFVYQEMLGQKDELIIIGGGHC
ncbi:MAG: XdhC family protein, partial [Blastocatellia bacterium]|nr:XdhC family protein [Blastocatellia bacterium]